MQAESLQFTDSQDAAVLQNAGIGEGLGLSGYYDVKCLGADGQVNRRSRSNAYNSCFG